MTRVSAFSLNAEIARTFDEEDIYRIDHFLAKRSCKTPLRTSFRKRHL